MVSLFDLPDETAQTIVRAQSYGDIDAGTSASLFEGLNRVVGDGLSAQDWFATKKAEEAPIKLPWEASIAEELPYERYTI